MSVGKCVREFVSVSVCQCMIRTCVYTCVSVGTTECVYEKVSVSMYLFVHVCEYVRVCMKVCEWVSVYYLYMCVRV